MGMADFPFISVEESGCVVCFCGTTFEESPVLRRDVRERCEGAVHALNVFDFVCGFAGANVSGHVVISKRCGSEVCGDADGRRYGGGTSCCVLGLSELVDDGAGEDGAFSDGDGMQVFGFPVFHPFVEC